jgi:hypothetical protein
MHKGILLLGGAVAVVASTRLAASDPPPVRRAAQTIDVAVRVDCLAGRGVSFSLIPWSVTVSQGDSINWILDPQSNVDSMEVVGTKGKGWPFTRKPPYKVAKNKPNGAKDHDLREKPGKYKYAVQAVCVRVPSMAADTVLIDPDMIIVRGGGT